MPFDLGFNFRSTAGYVTDPAYAVPALGEAYPHTYTNANGYSVNAGWVSPPTGVIQRGNTAEPRTAGINYIDSSTAALDFKVDLSSGSAPGAGDYTVDLALGEQGFAHTQLFKLLDTTSVLIDGTNGGSGFNTASNHFIDATLADVTVTPGNGWTGTQVNKTFATSLAVLRVSDGFAADYDTPAHFRLALVAAAAASLLPPPNRFAHMLVR